MKRRRLEYESSPRFAQSWLDNQDNLVQREFEAAYSELAEQIFVVFARQTEK